LARAASIALHHTQAGWDASAGDKGQMAVSWPFDSHPSFQETRSCCECSGRNAMPDKPVRIPGPDHPITITPDPAHIIVIVADRVIADTRAALTLQEASYPAVHYIPREDVDMAQLQRTDHATYCPYKGDASYYSIPV